MVLQARVSDIEIEFIDGVKGDNIPDNAIPASRDHGRPPPATLGSWRAHMNAIQESVIIVYQMKNRNPLTIFRVVRRNLTSALILEDDTDWDVRIRSQLRSFALSSQALTQPLASSPGAFADSTFPGPTEGVLNTVEEISFDGLPRIVPPTTSPYGDNWDLLWLGHCGMQFPSVGQNDIPKGRVIHVDDETVPEKRYLYSFANPFTLVESYPEHTRAVHHVQEGVCSLGYAVSQKGAQRMLHEIALKDISDGFDILLRFFCEGAKGRRRHICLASQPGLFHHHRPAGPESAQSDIGNHGEGWRDQSLTDMVRWSTRLNADVLMDGGDVFHDAFPNGE